MRHISAKSLHDAAEAFHVDGSFISAEPYGDGHINDTFLATYSTPSGNVSYILQRINTSIFTKPVELMENIKNVTEYLSVKISAAGGNPYRETLLIIPSNDGKPFFIDDENGYWRMFFLIDNAISYTIVTDPEPLYEAGRAFGKFFSLLDDFPAASLNETIFKFHDTRKRFADFRAAVERDSLGRAKSCQKDIAFVTDREKDASTLLDMLEHGQLPLRVTHNDTKINNVLIDRQSGKAVCVIDLDTVMPGLTAYDFGDAIRAGANTGAEDEPDLTKVRFDLRCFDRFTCGYLENAAKVLSDAELKSLPIGAKLMTYECGMRFLTDYLDGDTYFKTHRDGHNLDRARTQFKLVSEMELARGEMDDIIKKYSQKS